MRTLFNFWRKKRLTLLAALFRPKRQWPTSPSGWRCARSGNVQRRSGDLHPRVSFSRNHYRHLLTDGGTPPRRGKIFLEHAPIGSFLGPNGVDAVIPVEWKISAKWYWEPV